MKSIVFMQGNPVHKGHMALFESVLEYSDTLDVLSLVDAIAREIYRTVFASVQ